MIQLDIFTHLPQRSFHNTIPLTGDDLRKAEKKAKSQEERVYEILKTAPNGMTRRDVVLAFMGQFTETSCGRCLTNLANDPTKEVHKTDEQRPGLYGSMNNVYKIK